MKRSFSSSRKIGPRTSSATNSPAKERPSSGAFDRSFLDNKPLDNPFSHFSQSASRSGGRRQATPDSSSPPSVAAATPDPGGQFMKDGGGIPSSPTRFADALSPFPDFGRSRSYANGLNETGASRTPAALAFHSGGDVDNLATPLIGKHIPKLAPPSTARLPSQFMPLSSPAPFWKFTADFGSSPAKPVQSSPVKGFSSLKPNGVKDEVDRRSPGNPAARPDPDVRSSSPAPQEAEIGMGSPTAPRSRGRSVSQPKASQQQQETPTQKKIPDRSATESESPKRLQTEYKQPQPVLEPRNISQPRFSPPKPDEDDEEEGSNSLIDLARGFQPIGSFHRSINAGAISG